jgi:hypothetical protein
MKDRLGLTKEIAIVQYTFLEWKKSSILNGSVAFF